MKILYEGDNNDISGPDNDFRREITATETSASRDDWELNMESISRCFFGRETDIMDDTVS